MKLIVKFSLHCEVHVRASQALAAQLELSEIPDLAALNRAARAQISLRELFTVVVGTVAGNKSLFSQGVQSLCHGFQGFYHRNSPNQYSTRFTIRRQTVLHHNTTAEVHMQRCIMQP